MVETVKKPSSNRSAKERRKTLFRVLDGVLSLAHKKIHKGGTRMNNELQNSLSRNRITVTLQYVLSKKWPRKNKVQTD
jgi:hypothetical protein